MRSFCTFLKRFLSTFFCIFGALQVLYILRTIHPSWGGPEYYSTRTCLCAAFVFALCHRFIQSEWLDQKLSVKWRFLICAVPCILTFGTLVYDYDIPNWLRMGLDITSKPMAIATFDATLIICTVIASLLFLFLERRHHKLGKKYDAALASYKKHAD